MIKELISWIKDQKANCVVSDFDLYYPSKCTKNYVNFYGAKVELQEWIVDDEVTITLLLAHSVSSVLNIGIICALELPNE